MERLSRNNLPYRIWTFEEVFFRGEEIIRTGKTATKPFFGDKRDTLNVGDLFKAKILEYRAEPYYSREEDEYFDKIAVVVCSDEDGLEIAAKALLYYRSFPYDESGNPYKLKSNRRRQTIRPDYTEDEFEFDNLPDHDTSYDPELGDDEYDIDNMDR